MTTVDHADIRGLGTTLLVSVGCLPRSRHEGLLQSLNVHEDCTDTGAASLPMARHFASVDSEDLMAQTASGTCCAMAQMKAAISRAIATTTWLACLPRAVSCR
jgi:hypothetical protein